MNSAVTAFTERSFLLDWNNFGKYNGVKNTFMNYDQHATQMKALEIDSQHKKASNHHANLPLEMYSFTL